MSGVLLSRSLLSPPPELSGTANRFSLKDPIFPSPAAQWAAAPQALRHSSGSSSAAKTSRRFLRMGRGFCLFKIQGSHFTGTLLPSGGKSRQGMAGQTDTAGFTVQGRSLSSPEAEGSALSTPKASPGFGIWGSLAGTRREPTGKKKRAMYIQGGFRDASFHRGCSVVFANRDVPAPLKRAAQLS